LRRREEILEAALELFGAQGYGGTTMSQVARASHISTGLLFRYYPTKAALLQTILARSEAPLRTLLDDIAIAAKESATCSTFLVRVALVYAEYVRLTQNHWILWLEHEDWMPARTKNTLNRLDQIIAEKLPTIPDYLPRKQSHVTTRVFLEAVFSLALLHERIGRDAPKGFSPEEYFRSIATSFGEFFANPPAETTATD
jgi:AcrR family transcriptional regulator